MSPKAASLIVTALTTFVITAGGALVAAISNGGAPTTWTIVAIVATGLVQSALTVQKYVSVPP